MLDVRPREQRLLLEVNDGPGSQDRHREGSQTFLFSSRERRWFVTRVHGDALIAEPRLVAMKRSMRLPVSLSQRTSDG